MTLLEPKRVTVKAMDGTEREYIISKFPALAGRKIITQYLPTAMPKVGEYGANEALLIEMMAFVAVITPDGGELRLTTRGLIDNHVPDYEALMRLEVAMMNYNSSVFQNVVRLISSGGIEARAAAWITQTLTRLSESSSAPASAPSKTSSRGSRSKRR
jgi:hypothetical protein